ncbi:hypothetical protein BDV19DRAFT_239377 [Aspergillus venezuelensis]
MYGAWHSMTSINIVPQTRATLQLSLTLQTVSGYCCHDRFTAYQQSTVIFKQHWSVSTGLATLTRPGSAASSFFTSGGSAHSNPSLAEPTTKPSTQGPYCAWSSRVDRPQAV